MAGPVEIRACTPGDLETLYQIDQACFPRGIAYSRRTLREYLSLPEARCLVTAAGDEIAGFILTHAEGTQGHIITLDVIESYRRHGLGSMLLEAAEDELVARGVDCILLETATSNDAAIAFWRKHGYVAFGVAQAYYGRGRDAYVMRKPIGPGQETQST